MRDVAYVSRTEVRNDIEGVGSGHLAPETHRVVVGLNFENFSGNQILMRGQELVQVMAIDRRAALESVRR